MAQNSIEQQIESEQKAIEASRKKIADLKVKSHEQRQKKLLKAAEKAGFYKTEISDAAILDAIKKLVSEAEAPQNDQSTTATTPVGNLVT